MLHYNKRQKPSLFFNLLAFRPNPAVFIGKRRFQKTRRGYALKIDAWAHHRATETRRGNTRDLGPLFWCGGSWRFGDIPDMLRFGYFHPKIRLTCTRVQVQCIFQEIPCLASKKYRFNYPKMGLIKLLLPFCPPCLDYLQERPKHDLDRHFVYKSAGKCDTIMQNCRLIRIPFHKQSQTKKKKQTTNKKEKKQSKPSLY